jgi:hypothetical protein
VDGQPNDRVGRIRQRRWLFERRREILRAIWGIAYANGDGKSDTHLKSNGDSDSYTDANSYTDGDGDTKSNTYTL